MKIDGGWPRHPDGTLTMSTVPPPSALTMEQKEQSVLREKKAGWFRTYWESADGEKCVRPKGQIAALRALALRRKALASAKES